MTAAEVNVLPATRGRVMAPDTLRSANAHDNDGGGAHGVIIGVVAGCVFVLGILAVVLFTWYRRRQAANSTEDQYPAANPAPPPAADLEGVEGAVMVPIENKSMFLNNNYSIALTLVHSEHPQTTEKETSRASSVATASSRSSFSSNCSSCVLVDERESALPRDDTWATSWTGAAPPPPHVSRPRPPTIEMDTSVTRRTVHFRSQPTSTVASPLMPHTYQCRPFAAPASGGTSPMERAQTAAFNPPSHSHEPFAANGRGESPAGGPSTDGPSPSRQQHHADPQGCPGSPGSPHTRHQKEERRVPDVDYPSEKVDEETKKTCKLYRRRASELVYGTSSYMTEA